MSISMNKKRVGILALSFAFVAATFAAAVPSQAAESVRAPSDNITICHRTNSASNPYVKITVDPNALFRQGHDTHTGDVFDAKIHDQQNRGWGDIIPPFEYEYKQGNQAVSGSYPGLNWTEAGQAILDNGCSVSENGTAPKIVVSVSPVFECYLGVDNGYIAYFGFSNNSTIDGEPYEVYIPYGEDNKFTPSPIDRGQPEFFEPGRTGFVDDAGVFKPENAAVAIPFDGSNLVWTLDGSTATASSNREDQRCPEPAEEYFFQFDKEWVGDVEGIDLDELKVTFIADDGFKWTFGVTPPVSVVPGVTTLTNVEEVVSGLPAQCTSTADVLPLETLTAPKDVELYGEDNLFTLTITNTIECEEGVVLGDDDEKKEGEILAATTVRSLPETGSSASIVASIAAIVATSLAMASSLVKGAFVRFTA